MSKAILLAGAAFIMATMVPASSWAKNQKKTFTSEFGLDRCTFSPTGENPYFILLPGYQLTLEGEEDKELVNITITVLNQTRDVDGVTTSIIEEVETADGELAEISQNYFAICQETNSVFYFGEDVDIYEDGEVVSHEGSWLAGEDDALPGLIMPGTILLGSRYFQEVAPEVALDQAEIIRMFPCEALEEPVENCIETFETTPLEPRARDFKTYAPGIGLIRDGSLELIGVQPPF